jgi:hypothetical protein
MKARNLLRLATLLGTLVAAHRAMGQSPALFIMAPSYAAGANPVSVAVADFNGDGHPDLVLANNTTPGTVSVLLGNGDGTFQAAQSYAAGANPVSVAVGDFNGDGHSDVVVANYAGTVSLLLGNGDGTFQAVQTIVALSAGGQVVVGDFNGDGHPDLAVTSDAAQGTVSILLGNGDGTFQPPQSYAAGSFPLAVAVADFNRDGLLDLAVTNNSVPFAGGTVSILLGNGDGTFQSPQSYATGANPFSVAVGDFNGDGAPDLAVADYYDNKVNVLLGNGDGTFQAATPYAIGAPNALGSQNSALAVGDFNADGHLDLSVITAGSATVVILLGNGDGTFHAALANPTAIGSNLSALAVGDFNGDGHPDLAVANNRDGTVSILLGNGDTTFRAAESYLAGPFPSSIAVGDFNGDRHLDLVVANSTAGSVSMGTVSVLLGNGHGTFGAARSYAAGINPVSVAVGDFNGDGYLDIAVANAVNSLPSTVSVLLGNGDGTFQAAQGYAAGTDPRSVVVGDFNGDGILDLAVADAGTFPNYTDRGVMVLLNNGDGTFQAGQTYAALGPALAVADLNGDGKLDLVTSGGSVLLGNGDGSFQAAPSLAASSGPFGGPNSIAVGDFNGDGKIDIVIGEFAYYINDHPHLFNITESDVRVFLGNGDGTFQAAATFAAGPGPNAVAVGDCNADGNSDIVVADGANPFFFPTTVSVLLGKGDGSFLAPQSFGVDTRPVSVAVGDFNGDGYPDLAVIEQTDRVTILLNAANRGG